MGRGAIAGARLARHCVWMFSFVSLETLSQVMQLGLSGLQIFLDESDAFGRAEIPPKAVEAKPIERFSGRHHPWIRLRRRAELSRLGVIVHKIKNFRLEN